MIAAAFCVRLSSEQSAAWAYTSRRIRLESICRPHECRRELRNYAVADAFDRRTFVDLPIGQAISQSEGNPINARLKAGFNATGASIGASDASRAM
jgi:hypothetical protein